MDASIPANLTVSELLAAHPQTASVFLKLHTSCVGCHLARFCKLEEVANFYTLPLQDLLDQLTASRDQISALPSNTD